MDKRFRTVLVVTAVALTWATAAHAISLRRCLNDLVNDAAHIALGTVIDISYDVVDGRAWTNVTLDREARLELGGESGPITFSVPGGPIGNLIEWVSDTPSFRIGERALVMLKPDASGRLGVVSGIQGKIDVVGADSVAGSSRTLSELLCQIQAVRQGTVSEPIPAPQPTSQSRCATQAVGEPVADVSCCAYMTSANGKPIRWSSSCPNIHYRIYDNSGISGASAAIQAATESWNAVPCSCARLTCDGSAAACGDNVVCWANLSDNTIGLTTIWYTAVGNTYYISKFEMQFNTDFAWVTNCSPSGMDVQTIALHEFGHVLAMADLYDPSCSGHIMYGYAYEGLCKRDPTIDAACLTGLYPTAPTLDWFAINNGASQTTSNTVTLNNSASCAPTQYMASESPSFSGASWLTYSSAPTFTLSPGLGNKTVYLKVKNSVGVSSVLNDSITLVAPVPAAPSNPGATNVTTASIRWTWTDNSSDEAGFNVYADPGSDAPTTLRTTTPPNATYWDYSGLIANTQYAFQVAATNGTTESARTPTLARHTLALAPTFGNSGDGRIDCDRGPGGSNWHPAATTITFTAVNGFGAGPSRASCYRWIWDQTAGEPNWAGASTWASGSLVQAPTATGSYYLHLQAANGDLVYNPATLSLGPYCIDADPPSAPVVTDSGTYQSDTAQLHASWTAALDVGSGVCEYQYAIGASPNDLIVPWKSAGLDTAATETNLALVPGVVYHWYVRARDCAGNWSSTAASDGIVIVQHPAIGVQAAKSLPDGASVGLDTKVVTAVIDTGFYVQGGPPWAGIRIECAKPPAGLAAGCVVDIGGTMCTNASGEKLIAGIAALRPGTAVPHALGLTNASVGGASWNYDAPTGAGQQGMEGGVGLNNVGMFVRVWGRVVDGSAGVVGLWNANADFGLSIDDGSGVMLRLAPAAGQSMPSPGSYVSAEGVCSCCRDNAGKVRPLIRVTSWQSW